MANIKSAKKRIKVTAKRTLINRIRKSQIKTAIRRFEEALASGDIAKATENFRYAQKKIMQVAAKGTIHKNAGARKVSKLAAKLNKAAN
ncbi:MAG: 30S ribosomal protein S20 [Filifactoraceae bacterium]